MLQKQNSEQNNPRPTRIWPLAIGTALIILFAWVAIDGTVWQDGDADMLEGYPPVPYTSEVGSEPAMPSPVNRFIAYVDDEETRFDDDSLHAQTAEAIVQLSEALGATSDWSNVSLNFDAKRDSLQWYADQLDQVPHAEHGRYVSEAFNLSSELLTEIQQNGYPGLNVTMAEIRQVARAINPNEDLSEQRELVEAYFDRTRRLFEDIQHLEEE